MEILTIEDERDLAASLKSALQEEGHAVTLAFDGDAGLDLMSRLDFDIVILDWMLPTCDGLEVCRALRRGRQPNIPVLMLTVRNDVEDRVAGLRNGADDYLGKPFALSELLARVEALGRRSDRAGGARKFANLVLDPESRAVRRAGELMFLSSREYSLLHYLISRPGEVVSRGEIAEHAWELPLDYESTNLVDAHVVNLRKKLDRTGEPSIIRTVRGRGYCLDDNRHERPYGK